MRLKRSGGRPIQAVTGFCTGTSGNVIGRVRKDIQEMRNVMMDEVRFPHVAFPRGSNFATTTFFAETPEGRKVRIAHDAGDLNRMDRVTSGSYGMEINGNHCRNIYVELDGTTQMLQAASFHYQSESWAETAMENVLWDVAMSSLELLSESLPAKGDQHEQIAPQFRLQSLECHEPR